ASKSTGSPGAFGSVDGGDRGLSALTGRHLPSSSGRRGGGYRSRASSPSRGGSRRFHTTVSWRTHPVVKSRARLINLLDVATAVVTDWETVDVPREAPVLVVEE
ncbi:MAG: hypothetical protein V5A56_16115, partial [Halolamina sp.]